MGKRYPNIQSVKSLGLQGPTHGLSRSLHSQIPARTGDHFPVSDLAVYEAVIEECFVEHGVVL